MTNFAAHGQDDLGGKIGGSSMLPRLASDWSVNKVSIPTCPRVELGIRCGTKADFRVQFG
jgi:hypothetical protein